jgi:hypothetical protein
MNCDHSRGQDKLQAVQILRQRDRIPRAKKEVKEAKLRNYFFQVIF